MRAETEKSESKMKVKNGRKNYHTKFIHSFSLLFTVQKRNNRKVKINDRVSTVLKLIILAKKKLMFVKCFASLSVV